MLNYFDVGNRVKYIGGNSRRRDKKGIIISIHPSVPPATVCYYRVLFKDYVNVFGESISICTESELEYFEPSLMELDQEARESFAMKYL